jgi:hypothetical protein
VYQIEGREVLWAWLEKESDPANRTRMLEFMVDLATDPSEDAHRVPGIRAPVYLRVTPVRNVTVTYLIAEQFKVVKLSEFGTLP